MRFSFLFAFIFAREKIFLALLLLLSFLSFLNFVLFFFFRLSLSVALCTASFQNRLKLESQSASLL